MQFILEEVLIMHTFGLTNDLIDGAWPTEG